MRSSATRTCFFRLRNQSTQRQARQPKPTHWSIRVRARAKVPDLTPGLNAAAFKDSVFVERRFELAMEMHGVFDSRRNWTWAKARVESNMAQIAALNRSPFTSSVEKFNAAPIPDKWRLVSDSGARMRAERGARSEPGWTDVICKPGT